MQPALPLLSSFIADGRDFKVGDKLEQLVQAAGSVSKTPASGKMERPDATQKANRWLQLEPETH